MRFAKMHGIGNDYVVVDARKALVRRSDWQAAAKILCDRHFGVGSDGLVLVETSDTADFKFRMLNPDGSEAEMCGNGIRCFAKYVADFGLVDKQVEWLIVETLAGVRRVKLMRENGEVVSVQVSMGAPVLRPSRIPVILPQSLDEEPDRVLDLPVIVGSRHLTVACVSMGNPHAVAFLDEPVASFPLVSLGPLVELHPAFPNRINFEIVNVESPDQLNMRVWERGAGETMACGTGACAVAVAARLLGFIGDKVDITLPGGILTVEWDGRGEVLLTGPAALVFEGEWRGPISF
ncbi:MAG: diaminopimelate epimerase [Dehalococcoidia bacterium]|nr:diaminopimelate epimerase [Dehalococcoidia bacterium]